MRLMTAGRAIVLTMAVLVSGLFVPVAWSQAASPPQAGAEAQLEQSFRTAPVIVDGVVLFRVRGVSSFPAEQRAQLIADRIKALAADPAFDPQSLRIEETELATQLMADRQLVMGVYEGDGRVEGVERQVLATLYLDQVRRAIATYRADRSGPALQRVAIEALTSTLVFAVLVTAIIWVRRKLDAFLERKYGHKVEDLAAKSHDLVSAARLWNSFRTLLRYASVAAVVVLLFIYLNTVLSLVPHTRTIARNLASYVVGPLATMWRSFIAAIPDLMFLAVLFVVVRIVLRLIRRFFDGVEQGRIHLANFDREWAAPTYKLVRPAVIAFAVVVGYPYIPGSSSDAFKGVSLFLGIVFSLGSSSFIANMIAGYTMTYRRAFRMGDLVQIGDVTGIVTQMRLQVTHLRTMKNEEVVLPNSQILGTHVTNYSTLAQSSGLILHTTVGIGYETPWRQVEAMLLEAARRTPGLMAKPAPWVLLLALGDFCVTYELNVACAEPLKMKATYTNLHRHILDVFNEYGVQIMTPAYEADPAVAKVVPKDQWYLEPAKPAPSPEGGQTRG